MVSRESDSATGASENAGRTQAAHLKLINAENVELMDSLGGVREISLDAEAGRLTFQFNCLKRFCHSNGRIAQGGFVTAWMDSAMAHAVVLKTGRTHNVASLDINVSFLERVGPGIVQAHASVVRLGRSVAFLEASLTDEHGKLLATATSSGLLIPISG